MKIIFFGLGSIGRRHLKLLLGTSHKLYAFTTHSRRSLPHQSPGVVFVKSWKEVDAIRPDVAFITNPTDLHIDTALECARRGMHLFIEKPLSHSLKGVEELKKITKEKGLTVYVAYCLRFHPVIMWLKRYLKRNRPFYARAVLSSYLPHWRPGQDYRASYSSSARRGGGVILDQSHELDYLISLFGQPLRSKGMSSHISPLILDAEDYLDLAVSFRNVSCNIHMDFFSHITRREIHLDFKNSSVIADLLDYSVTVVKNGKTRKIRLKQKEDGFYRSQLNYFFTNIRNRRLMNNLDEASIVLSRILEIKKKVIS